MQCKCGDRVGDEVLNVRIEKGFQDGKEQFFVDYEIDKKSWKNYSVEDSYDKAVMRKMELQQEHVTSAACWCNPEFIGGIYVHRATN